MSLASKFIVFICPIVWMAYVALGLSMGVKGKDLWVPAMGMAAFFVYLFVLFQYFF